MTQEDLPARRASGPGAGGMSERMQALLSRAAEEQLSEQRQVSAVLTDLRALVSGLGEQLRETASSARLQGLAGDVATLSTELRLATAGLGDRLDELGRRVDEQAVSTAEVVRAAGAGSDAAAVRTASLAGDLAAQADVLDRVGAALRALSGLPDAVSALREEVRGLQDRLAPLAEVRTQVTELAVASTRVDSLRDDVAGLSARVDALPTATDVRRGQESLGAAVGERLGAVDARLTEVSERTAQLGAVRDDLEALRAEVGRLHEDVALPQVMLALGGLREDVEDLAGHLARVEVPTADAVAAATTTRMTDHLVGELAPRVADLVLARVAATLVEQVSGSVSASVQNGLTERVRAANADTERRLSAHVDEAVLALAEALLRRRRGRPPAVALAGDPPVVPGGVVPGAAVRTATGASELDPAAAPSQPQQGPQQDRQPADDGRPTGQGRVTWSAEPPSTSSATAAQDPTGDAAPLLDGPPVAEPVVRGPAPAGSADEQG